MRSPEKTKLGVVILVDAVPLSLFRLLLRFDLDGDDLEPPSAAEAGVGGRLGVAIAGS
jgi:hypothetical protein